MFRTFRKHWRHFSPLHKRRPYHKATYQRRNTAEDTSHLSQPQQVEYVCSTTDFFDCAEQRVVGMMQRRPEAHELDRYIPRLRAQFDASAMPHDGLVALLAQVPRAILAQLQMDKFEHGYRNKQERLYELIDFNDTLVSTILAMDERLREQFEVRVKQAADRICLRVGAPQFSDEQWGAIIRGLTREVAVYLAAKENGFNAYLTDRAHDALGIDIQIQDPEDRRYINIDVKTPSSFRRRMEQLLREDRLTERQVLIGDERGYVIEHNGHGKDKVEVIVLCILPDRFGDLANWQFVDTAPMRETLNRLIRDHGLSDDRYGDFSALRPGRY